MAGILHHPRWPSARRAVPLAGAACVAALVTVAVTAHLPFTLQPARPKPVPITRSAVQLIRTSGWSLSAAQIDNGLQSAIAQDLHDGMQMGLEADFRDGARSIRVLARRYASPSGAQNAYALAARYVRQVLPDPVLHTRIGAFPRLGPTALFAMYDSSSGHAHYTVSALLFLAGTTVCQAQAFPAAVQNGDPARDRADLLAVAPYCSPAAR